jgi:GT2 family glycosyltransferase
LTKVAVVILNYNGRKFLKEFLPIVIERSGKDAEIWVADNQSTDDSVDLMKEHFPDVKLIVNDENGGFAKGYNDALSKIEAEYYVLLNSDIEVTDNWIQPVIELMDSDSNIAACQPKIRAYHDKSKFEYAGASGGYLDKFGYPFCRGRVFQVLEEDDGQYDNPVEVFWATGACMFVRAETYHKLGGLDADFFAHMEEVDFCWRLKNNDYKVMVCPSSVVYHIGGGTLPKSSARKTYLNFRNNFSLLYKNLPSDKLLKVFILRLFLDGMAGIKFLAEGHFQDFLAVFKAHFYFYGNWGKLSKKRKKLKQKRVPHMYRGNIALEHYLKGIKHFSDLDTERFTK